MLLNPRLHVDGSGVERCTGLTRLVRGIAPLKKQPVDHAVPPDCSKNHAIFLKVIRE